MNLKYGWHILRFFLLCFLQVFSANISVVESVFSCFHHELSRFSYTPHSCRRKVKGHANHHGKWTRKISSALVLGQILISDWFFPPTFFSCPFWRASNPDFLSLQTRHVYVLSHLSKGKSGLKQMVHKKYHYLEKISSRFNWRDLFVTGYGGRFYGGTEAL